MDIQKEREAFDEWHYNQYLLENPNIDISNAKYIYDYAHKNVLVCQLRESHFTAWQAAKAQAVQEWINVDDRLPPVDETVLVCWDYAPDIEPEKEYTTIDENLDEYWPNCQDEPPTHWMPLPKVVKAQEPTND